MSSSNAAALDVPCDRISHYFNSYGNSRGSAAMPARRKLLGQCKGQCRRGVCVGEGDRGGTGHTEVAVEGTDGATGGGGSGGGGFDSANVILNSPPGDVPVIDNVRPLDRKPFARSVTKFMKVSSALVVDNCR